MRDFKWSKRRGLAAIPVALVALFIVGAGGNIDLNLGDIAGTRGSALNGQTKRDVWRGDNWRRTQYTRQEIARNERRHKAYLARLEADKKAKRDLLAAVERWDKLSRDERQKRDVADKARKHVEELKIRLVTATAEAKSASTLLISTVGLETKESAALNSAQKDEKARSAEHKLANAQVAAAKKDLAAKLAAAKSARALIPVLKGASAKTQGEKIAAAKDGEANLAAAVLAAANKNADAKWVVLLAARRKSVTSQKALDNARSEKIRLAAILKQKEEATENVRIAIREAPPVPDLPPVADGVTPAPDGSPAPVPDSDPQLLVEVPRQNLVLRFVDPNRKPVAGVRLMADVQPEQGTPVQVEATTDETGRLRLEKIPLPATVELKVVTLNEKPEAAEKANEWDFAEVTAAIILVDEPIGKKLHTPQITRREEPIRLASLRLPRGISLIRKVSESEPSAGIAQGKARGPASGSTYLAADDSSKVIRRDVTYEGEQAQPIEMLRSVVDVVIVGAPPAGKISSPALIGGDQVVPENGRVACRMMISSLKDGLVPLVVSKNLPGGGAETIIRKYETDPYKPNEEPCPSLTLVNLSSVKLLEGVTVLASQPDIIAKFGKPGKKNKGSSSVDLPDGSDWWIYPAAGLAFKLRRTTLYDQPLVERIRVFTAAAGNVGGVVVGSPLEETYQALGEAGDKTDKPLPSDTVGPTVPGATISYLEGGLRICHADGKILWYELVRATRLLLEGTTAFVQNDKTRVYVESFDGHPRSVLHTKDDLSFYLEKVRAVNVVQTAGEADLIISAATSFTEDKDGLTDLIPYNYDCSTQLTYTIRDAVTGQPVLLDSQPILNKQVLGKAKANFTKDLAIALAIGIAASKIGKGMIGKIGPAFIGIGALAIIHKKMQRAVNRCPGISARSAFNGLTGDLNRAANFAVRVSQIDYTTGIVHMNAGHDKDIKLGDEFQISTSRVPLHTSSDSGKSADYYAAVVTGVSQTSCVAKLQHIYGKVKDAEVEFKREDAVEMARRIPEPATGLVSARAWVEFPVVQVITDKEVDDAVNAARERGDASLEEAKNLNKNPKPAGGLGGLLDLILK